jgi:hypothetical protein
MAEITRDEATTILNLIGDNADYTNEGTMSVLTKINKAYPGLLSAHPKHAKAVLEYVRNAAETRQAATKQIATILDNVREQLGQAAKLASKAKIGFDLYMGDISMQFSHEDGWYSSNC